MALIAKPIVKNQLWVVTDGARKVGNVESTVDGYSLKLGGMQKHFHSTKAIEGMVAIKFQRPHTPLKFKTPYAKWPTTGKTYNSVFDIKRRIHIYTKTRKSKCYYAAGWFRIKMGEGWQNVFCPKYIFIQRYEYAGPFYTEEEADSHK